MIVVISLCVLACILSVLAYFVTLYGITESSFKMLCSQDEYEIINNNYIPPYATKNTQKAAVMCRDYKDVNRKRVDYKGFADCRMFKKTYETEYYCKSSCSGFGSCLSVCPQNAISLQNGIAIISDSCNGCGLCLDVCPQHLIKLVGADKDNWIDCIAPDCYEVNEKMNPIEKNTDKPDPLQKKITYSKHKYFKIWKAWVNI
jgi:NAD-dependent dihydropyrimidine dehydrogenase PreA subunit